VFRIVDGHDAIPLAIWRSIPQRASLLRLSTPVESIRWRRGLVEIKTGGPQSSLLRCRRAIVTVSLGVLQAGAIRFDPEPPALRAAQALGFGQVYRVTFR
jgi:hypothetical protein